jgi:hypothetical protein
VNNLELNVSSGIGKKPSAFKHCSVFDRISFYKRHYTKLCSRFLPIVDNDSIWRYSPHFNSTPLEQGWKLHISATILTANEVLEKAAPFLQKQKVCFKAPSSLVNLKNLNAGIVHGYSQIGKFITVYPQSDNEAVSLAEQLHQLTSSFSAPAIPFDLRYKPESCIYYRYGSFKNHQIINADGSQTLAVRDASGNLVPDLRDAEDGKPAWITNPFPVFPKPDTLINPLDDTFKVFRAVSQRGKGGVYEALDFSVNPPRLCIVKEGRRNGETDWDGRDGFARVRHEEKMLETLMSAGVEVPRVYASFETENNYYLVVESIAGKNLQDFLEERKKRLAISRVARFALEIANLVAQIHSVGLVWRDLKPPNLFVTKNGRFRPLDFEGACLIGQPDLLLWGTQSFMSRESNGKYVEHSKPAADIFALGIILYYLIEGKLPEISGDAIDFKIKRRQVPTEIHRIIEQLLDPNPEQRPDANTVRQTFRRILSNLS